MEQPTLPDWAVADSSEDEKASWNNRLVRYDEYAGSVAEANRTRTVVYTFFENGDVSDISVNDVIRDGLGAIDEAETKIWRNLKFVYSSSHQLALAVWGNWTAGPNVGSVIGMGEVDDPYVKTAAVEFQYHDGLSRYLRREVDPNNSWIPLEQGTWTDYLGDMPWSDYTYDSEIATVGTPVRSYFLGMGQQTAGESDSTRYFHSDLLGSTNLSTKVNGTQAGDRYSYTAFGEPIANGNGGTAVGVEPENAEIRYRYVGALGYENDLLALSGAAGTKPIVLQHVGARWYQASIGRFVQRDGAGVDGGLNMYSYVDACPSSSVDPIGESRIKIFVYVGKRFLGYWRQIGMRQAVSRARQGAQILVTGPNGRATGKNISKRGYGECIRHNLAKEPTADGPHYQPRKRTGDNKHKGHVFWEPGALMLIWDLVNPVGDACEIYDAIDRTLHPDYGYPFDRGYGGQEL